MNSKLLAANPAIDSSRLGIGERCHSGESVVSVQDAETKGTMLENNGHGHLACACDEFASTEKLFLTIRDICECWVKPDARIVLDDCGDKLLRVWAEKAKREREFVPFPRELADRLDALMVEHLLPS